jgi:hypothetical protein
VSISPKCIYQLVSLMETNHVFCEVGTECFNIIFSSSCLQGSSYTSCILSIGELAKNRFGTSLMYSKIEFSFIIMYPLICVCARVRACVYSCMFVCVGGGSVIITDNWFSVTKLITSREGPDIMSVAGDGQGGAVHVVPWISKSGKPDFVSNGGIFILTSLKLPDSNSPRTSYPPTWGSVVCLTISSSFHSCTGKKVKERSCLL